MAGLTWRFFFNGHVYIFEFKVEKDKPEGHALAQIKERNYADKYQDRNEPIHLIGVEFSKEHRNIAGFDYEWSHREISCSAMKML